MSMYVPGCAWPRNGGSLQFGNMLREGANFLGGMCLEATGDYLPPGGRARVTREHKRPSLKSTHSALSGVALSRVPWER